jgi:hypothetical protein
MTFHVVVFAKRWKGISRRAALMVAGSTALKAIELSRRLGDRPKTVNAPLALEGSVGFARPEQIKVHRQASTAMLQPSSMTR